MEDKKTREPPLALTDLLGDCSVAVRDLSDAIPYSVRQPTVSPQLFLLSSAWKTTGGGVVMRDVCFESTNEALDSLIRPLEKPLECPEPAAPDWFQHGSVADTCRERLV